MVKIYKYSRYASIYPPLYISSSLLMDINRQRKLTLPYWTYVSCMYPIHIISISSPYPIHTLFLCYPYAIYILSISYTCPIHALSMYWPYPILVLSISYPIFSPYLTHIISYPYSIYNSAISCHILAFSLCPYPSIHILSTSYPLHIHIIFI